MDAKTRLAAQALLSPAQKYDERASLTDMAQAINYLTLFGYLAKFAVDNITPEHVDKALKTFQGWFGLKRDGIVAGKTLKAMAAPRCGCPDILRPDDPEQAGYIRFMQSTRNASNLTRWNKTGLRYYVNGYVTGLSRSEQDGIIAGAWKAWDDVCGVQIGRTNVAREADLIIDVGDGRRFNFDGPNGVLAWAYLPDGADRQLLMRFDLAETWISNAKLRGILLFNVACHEFGHMLGLDHSKRQGALMAPTYNPVVAVPQWDDDIPRVHARYGQDTSTPQPEEPQPPSGHDYDIHVTGRLEIAGYQLVPKR